VPSFQNSFSQAIEAAFMKLDAPPTSDPLSGKGRNWRAQHRAVKLSTYWLLPVSGFFLSEPLG
jgi:hypothetical protein